MRNWYYKLNDKELGPISEDELLYAVEQGELTKTTLIRKDTVDIWVKASSINGLLPSVQKSLEQKRRLPILETIKETFTVMIENANVLWKPLLITALLMIVVEVSIPSSQFEIILASKLVYAVAFVMFTVATHRIVLLGKESVATHGLSWRRKEWVFVLYSVGIYILLTILTLVMSPIIGMIASSEIVSSSGIIYLGVLIVMLMSYFFMRLSMLFPAIAIEKKNIDLSWAMTITQHNGWRLVAVLTVIPFFLNLFITYISGSSFVLNVLAEVMVVLLLVFEIVALSLSFKYLTNFEGNEFYDGLGMINRIELKND